MTESENVKKIEALFKERCSSLSVLQLPKYMSNAPVKPRSGTATSSARYQLDQAAMEAKANEFLQKDKVDNFKDLLDRLHGETALPTGFAFF